MRPDHYAEWFTTFHEYLWNSLKNDGSLVINIKDKIVNNVSLVLIDLSFKYSKTN